MTAPKFDPATSEEVPTDEEVARDFATGDEPEPPIDPDDDTDEGVEEPDEGGEA